MANRDYLKAPAENGSLLLIVFNRRHNLPQYNNSTFTSRPNRQNVDFLLC